MIFVLFIPLSTLLQDQSWDQFDNKDIFLGINYLFKTFDTVDNEILTEKFRGVWKKKQKPTNQTKFTEGT